LAEYRKLPAIHFFFKMKTIHVTVRLSIKEDAEPWEVVESLDYSFEHEDIIETEIVNVCDEKNVDMF